MFAVTIYHVSVALLFQISQSNSSSVTLSDVHRDLTGFYKCEVSADAPLFHTGIKSALVIVTGISVLLFQYKS